VYGFTGRGIKGENALFFSWLFHAYGGSWTDSGGKLTTDQMPAAVDAVLAYAQLMAYTPPGGTGFSWLEARNSFSRGEAAFFAEGYGGSISYMQDPAQSAIAGDVEYGFLPGAEGRPPVLITTQLGWTLNPYSSKQGPAWYFLQWASSKQMALDVLMDVGDTWVRRSAYADPAYMGSDTFIPEFNEAVLQALNQPSTPMLPFLNNVGEWRDDFGLILNGAVENPDPDRIREELIEYTAKYNS
jgi:multiple sugar transport system substrate-binding protein